uniref:Candidate secreted effector n=1 Tax=Meloidogyne incognita TaxID=6306 RepID=A0A914MVV7_MELIC
MYALLSCYSQKNVDKVSRGHEGSVKWTPPPHSSAMVFLLSSANIYFFSLIKISNKLQLRFKYRWE